MPNEMQQFDRVFHALSNSTRREVIARLAEGPTAMTVLAEPFNMALPSFLQHMQVLEAAGLVNSSKTGRTRVYQIQPQQLIEAEHWMDKHRSIWEARLNQFDDFVILLKESNP